MKKGEVAMRFFSLIMLSLIAFFAIGCGTTSVNNSIIIENSKKTTQAAQSGASSSKNVALVMKTLTNPFLSKWRRGHVQQQRN